MEKQHGYFFTALLPMYDQMSASMYRTIPIAPAEQVSIRCASFRSRTI